VTSNSIHIFAKILLILILGITGFAFGYFFSDFPYAEWIGMAWGIGIAFMILLVEFAFRKVPSRTLIGALIGGFIGIALANFLTHSVLFNSLTSFTGTVYIQSSLALLCGLVGGMLGVKRLRTFDAMSLRYLFSDQSVQKNYKILDTSVIIDGRIADISETGFLEGILIIPQFILKELQHIADSPDPIKRNRGRRGLDILHKIQKRVDVPVEIHDKDFPKIKEIDAKLVELGKMLQAKLITNDFNLNKVAELQGVSVLNVNELANALKPVVLPGEIIEVQVLKEGKEYGQGIAYLDDGTMIVIDHAKKLIGKTVSVSVTSVLQTTAGRMIFGQIAPKDA
jgi:uncharacterized protein YacL